MLWKHRDTDFIENGVKYFSGERYPFIAIVNSVDANPTDVWIGTNSAGFSLMNTQSYNLVRVKEGEERGAANGRVMRRALEVCATVDDCRHEHHYSPMDFRRTVPFVCQPDAGNRFTQW